jgi:hypothetical protein
MAEEMRRTDSMLSEMWLSKDGSGEFKNRGSVKGGILSHVVPFFLNSM